MKVILSVLLCAIVSGCISETVVDERMVINPQVLVFRTTDSLQTVSITHTCTCPFTWWITAEPAAPWLITPTGNQQGDNASVHFAIDRTLLTHDSMTTLLTINSNSYGTDTMRVTAFR